jgi:hypothetical protein
MMLVESEIQSNSGRPEIDNERLSLGEIISKYSGKYVAIEVLTRDKDGQPTHGRVLQVHFDKYRLKDSVQNLRDVCIFFAGPAPKQGFLAVF